MKYILYIAALIFTTSCEAQSPINIKKGKKPRLVLPQEPLVPVLGENEVDVFLSAGQSNDDGRVTDFTLVDFLNGSNEVPNVYMWERTNSNFSLMQFGAGSGVKSGSNATDNTQWAFDVFTLRYLQQLFDRNLYVVKASLGGTALSYTATSSSWYFPYNLVTGTAMLQQLELRIEASETYWTSQGKTPKYRAMLWHQGESDAGDPSNYQTNMTTLIAKVREFTGVADLKFYIGTIPTTSAGYSATIRTAQDNIAAADPNVHVVDLANLTLADAFHFDAASAKEAGQR